MPKIPGPVYITYDMVKDMMDANYRDFGIRRSSYRLREGDSAWNPASTKRENDIHGPCKITYHRYEDGGIEARVE